jgi:DNA-binding beta-propeller fold protein YncE
MVRPFGVTVDAAQRIFVADPSQRAVLVCDRKTGSAARWTGNARYPLGGPVAVALDQDGRLFVADGYRAQVVVFDPAGNPVAAFGNGVLKRPAGIAVDAQRGRVYVGDVRLHQVLSFDLHTFAVDRTIGGDASKAKPDPAHFFSPANLAVNSQGHLYVSDMRNCQIQVFDADGVFLRRFATTCSQRGAYGRPYAIAIDRADRIYVAAPEDASLQLFEPDGKPLRLVAGPGTRPPQPPVRTGIAVDRDNRIYVVEQRPGEGRVLIFAQARDKRTKPPQTAGDRGNP